MIFSKSSTVSKGFAALGYNTIDADALYHSMLLPPSECLGAIRLEFGDGIFASDGSLDRSALAALVFSSKDTLERLNATVLPIVIAKMRDIIKEAEKRGDEVMIVDAPTLIESGFDKECDFVLSISAPQDVRIERIMKRDGIDESRARARVLGQKGDDFYRDASDAFICDASDADELFQKAREATGI